MSWYAQANGFYAYNSTQGIENAKEIASILYYYGYPKNVVAAICGNSAFEGGLNPWQWEGFVVPASTSSLTQGYGMWQYTPATKYINTTTQALYPNTYGPNFSDVSGRATDGDSQTHWLANNIASDWKSELYNYYYDDFQAIGVDISTFYFVTYANFARGVDNSNNPLTLPQLVGAFELCYERPADYAAANSYNNRVNAATYLLSQLPDPTPSSYRKMPWIYYLKRRH